MAAAVSSDDWNNDACVLRKLQQRPEAAAFFAAQQIRRFSSPVIHIIQSPRGNKRGHRNFTERNQFCSEYLYGEIMRPHERALAALLSSDYSWFHRDHESPLADAFATCTTTHAANVRNRSHRQFVNLLRCNDVPRASRIFSSQIATSSRCSDILKCNPGKTNDKFITS